MRTGWKRTLIVLLAATVGTAMAQNRGRGRGAPPSPMHLTVAGFDDGGEIPAKYTCAAQPSVGSPEINWSNAPASAVTFALILHDPDYRGRKSFEDATHWIIWNIPASEHQLAENVATSETLPNGASQGKNVANRTGFFGPCPPVGGGVHHYTFEFYAVDQKLDLAAGSTRAELQKALDGHIVGQAVYIGQFKR